jgi:hypothetical protein
VLLQRADTPELDALLTQPAKKVSRLEQAKDRLIDCDTQEFIGYLITGRLIHSILTGILFDWRLLHHVDDSIATAVEIF